MRALGLLVVGMGLSGSLISPLAGASSSSSTISPTERTKQHSSLPTGSSPTSTVDCPVDPRGNRYVMTRDSSGITFVRDTADVSVHTDPPTSGNWINADVNNDDRLDIGLRDPEASKYNSQYTLYVACGNGRYVKVLSETARDFHFIASDSSTTSDRPGIVTPHVKTASGQRWRQFLQKANGAHVLPNRPSITAVSRIYRMYDHLGRYAVVPRSAWYMGTVPYPNSVLQQVDRLPPKCPAGEKPPKVIGNDQTGTVLWRGNLNQDDHMDLIIKNDETETEDGEYAFTIYSGCEKVWYVSVFSGSALNVEVKNKREQRQAWKNILVTKNNDGTLEKEVLEYEHSKYKVK